MSAADARVNEYAIPNDRGNRSFIVEINQEEEVMLDRYGTAETSRTRTQTQEFGFQATCHVLNSEFGLRCPSLARDESYQLHRESGASKSHVTSATNDSIAPACPPGSLYFFFQMDSKLPSNCRCRICSMMVLRSWLIWSLLLFDECRAAAAKGNHLLMVVHGQLLAGLAS